MSFAKLFLLLTLVQYMFNTIVSLTEEEKRQYEADYKTIEDIPVIKIFWKHAKEQCHIFLHDDLRAASPAILEKCREETGFDYQNTNVPDDIYLGSITSMSKYPLRYDKCFTGCVLTGLNAVHNGDYEPTLKLKVTNSEKVELKIFHEKVTSTNWINTGSGRKAWASATQYAKIVLRNHTVKPIPEEHEDYWCLVAELHGYFLYYGLPELIAGPDQKDDTFEACIKNIPPLLIDGMGPPFTD